MSAKKKCHYNRDTHRVMLAADIHACNECGMWETKSDSWREDTPIPHKPTCSFYPSLVNLEIAGRRIQEKEKPVAMGKSQY